MWGVSSTLAGILVATAGAATAVTLVPDLQPSGVRSVTSAPAEPGMGGAALSGRASVSPAPDPRLEEALKSPRNFYFARAQYSDDGMYPGWKDWSTDFPKADRQFLLVLERLAQLDAYEHEQPVRLDDPELRRFPFIYAVEVGRMKLRPDEVKGLRAYLEAGGFLVVDDFWGTREWQSFEEQMLRVFPEYRLVDIPLSHPLFHAYYDVDEIVQVPNVGQGTSGGPTYEGDGYEARVRGIFDHSGRLMVVANWNTDLGDGWEWAEQPDYPLKYSTYAYRMGVNFIMYAMSH